jgi:hypothetical protein
LDLEEKDVNLLHLLHFLKSARNESADVNSFSESSHFRNQPIYSFLPKIATVQNFTPKETQFSTNRKNTLKFPSK